MGNEQKNLALGTEGIYDARQLGIPKMLILGIQHTFAMFMEVLPLTFDDAFEKSPFFRCVIHSFG